MKLLERLRDGKTLDLACTAGGMGALLLGRKVLGLALFAKGMEGLERRYRRENDFRGSLEERWQRSIEFYDASHAHPINRTLHVVGIPMIVGGAAGLLAFRPFRPLWLASAASFSAGWGLNFIGHGIFEKKAPAFADDPLSFVAGPIWDFQQLRARFVGAEPEAPRLEPEVKNVEAVVR